MPGFDDDAYARIRAVVEAIPPGRVATYGQVAALAGLGGHARQVGYAMRTLPDDSTVPWQRVINARGEVSARAGEDGLGPSQGFQRHLLEEEGVLFGVTGQVDLGRYGWDPASAAARRPPRPGAGSARATLRAFDRLLQELGSPARAAAQKRYLKSTLVFRGVSVPAVRRLARTWLREHRDVGPEPLLAVARLAFRGEVYELRSVALELLVARAGMLASTDLELLEWMLRRAGTWAHVDVIAPHLVGAVLERERGRTGAVLDRWLRDRDMWVRRAALLALLPSLAAGDRDWPRFVRYADAVRDEPEFFLRKAVGWILREVSKRDAARVAAFVESRAAGLAGVTFREAVRRLPARTRRRLEAARRADRG